MVLPCDSVTSVFRPLKEFKNIEMRLGSQVGVGFATNDQ